MASLVSLTPEKAVASHFSNVPKLSRNPASEASCAKGDAGAPAPVSFRYLVDNRMFRAHPKHSEDWGWLPRQDSNLQPFG